MDIDLNQNFIRVSSMSFLYSYCNTSRC